ncbi:helix-turn-helix domain-containing protein [Chryseobacterium populi]|uniref:Putative transcriptional regulator n=1 Tax=Chryseobacterium populi TaxID=1144316 RepID=J2KJR3_9FLAO|nr:helix-turn-helix transcriptional regulator [Chryseobacterium populi]EJL73318.1 putative transcriptional regulator [Chryseobacterium populi]
MTTLGTKLARLRSKKGYSQQEVADKLGISQPAYHKYESDEVKPGLENLFKIAEIYDVEIGELMDDVQNIISHNTIDSYIANAAGNVINPVFNMHSEELLECVMKSQQDLTELMTSQNKLIELLINKLKS